MTLAITTWNWGNGTREDLLEIARDCDAVCLQEASDRSRPLGKIDERDRFEVIRPKVLGAPATPVVFKPHRLELLEPFHRLLLPTRYIGPGAGPDHNKPKYVVGGKFRHIESGRIVRIGSTHIVPTQGNPMRRRAAVDHMKALHRYMDRPIPSFVGADWNQLPNRVEMPGWTGDPLEAKVNFGTHSHRQIDMVWWRRDKRVRFLNHREIENGSDHAAVRVEFQIR